MSALANPDSFLPPRFLCNSPPKDDPISVEELKQYNGTDESKPVYVAVKGTVFDVSPKREMYGTSSTPSFHLADLNANAFLHSPSM